MKTLLDIRDTFNLRYNNINSGVSPGINDYEISVFLTSAQRQVVDEYYSGTLLKQETFESTERARKALSGLVDKLEVVVDPSSSVTVPGVPAVAYACIPVPSPGENWLALSEFVRLVQVPYGGSCLHGLLLDVEVISLDSLSRGMKNPFRRPGSEHVYRVDMQGQEIMIVSRGLLRDPRVHCEYQLVYLRFPGPLILTDLRDFALGHGLVDYDLTIDNEYLPTALPLPYGDLVLDVIIDRAVLLATMDYKENTLSNRAALNARME